MAAGEQLSSGRYWDELHRGLGQVRPYSAQAIDTYCSRQLLRIFDRFLQPQPSRRLIEMGCALSGYLPLFRQRYGYEVHGVDYSPVGCEATVEGLRRSGLDLGGQIHCLDFLAPMPRLEGRFHCLVSFGVIEHFSTPAAVVRRFASLLAPDGTMITEIPNTASPFFRLLKRLDRGLFDMHARIDSAALADIHAEAGLDVLLCQYCGTLNYAVFKPRKLQHLTESLLWPTQNLLWRASERLGFYPQSRLLSPYILCIARARACPGITPGHAGLVEAKLPARDQWP